MSSHSKLITFVGTGGVGKTSLSLATAIEAARQGKKVAAITIDPSKRLQAVVGDGKKLEFFLRPGLLDIYVVEAQETFQSFVARHLGERLYDRIKNNRIYQQISNNLRETHNFAALAQMVHVFNECDYDLVILDTPPCHQVIDFFEAPERLKKFFSARGEKQQGVRGWVQNQGLRAIEQVFSRFVGHEFVDQIKGFFAAVGDLRGEIHNISERFIEILGQQDSQLLLVFSEAQDKVAEATYLQKELKKNNFQVTGLILNRAFHQALDLGKELKSQTDSREEQLYYYFMNKKQKSIQVIESMKQKTVYAESPFVMLPEFNTRLDSVEDVLQFSQLIKENWRFV